MSHWPKTGCSVIVEDQGKVLLIKRGKPPYEGYWSLPGGSQEAGETLESCARRELFEETGLRVNNLSFCAVRDRIQHGDDGALNHHFVLATFIARAFEGKGIAGDDASDIGWYSLSEMQSLLTTPGTPDFISEFVEPSGSSSH